MVVNYYTTYVLLPEAMLWYCYVSLYHCGLVCFSHLLVPLYTCPILTSSHSLITQSIHLYLVSKVSRITVTVSVVSKPRSSIWDILYFCVVHIMARVVVCTDNTTAYRQALELVKIWQENQGPCRLYGSIIDYETMRKLPDHMH